MLQTDGSNADVCSNLADLYPCDPGSWYIGVYNPVHGSEKHQATVSMDEMSGWRFREHDRNVIYACAWGERAPPSEWIQTFDDVIAAIRHVDVNFFQSWMVAPPQFARSVFLEISARLQEAGVRYHMLHVVANGNGLHVRRHGPAARVRRSRSGSFTAAIIFDTNFSEEAVDMK